MKDPRFAKFLVTVNGLVPLALLGWDLNHDALGANSPQFMLHTTGRIGLIFLVLTLAVTPVRKLTGWNWLSHFRRSLGLFAFLYAGVHLLIYARFELGFDWAALARDTADRPFIFLGMASLLLMLPLALTSTNNAIKRMGAKWWKRLHKLTYAAAVAAVVHFTLAVKVDTTLPYAFAAVLAVLFAYRAYDYFRPRLRASSAPEGRKNVAHGASRG